MNWEVLDVTGLYRNGWKGEITPESFSHPAKFARGLIRWIYEFLFDKGLLAKDLTVMDPFGGIGLGGLDAMRHGLRWIGVELEPKFVALGQANIDLWNSRYAGRFRTWGAARIVQGDSRRLREVLAEADAAVTSPPFGAAQDGGGLNKNWPGGDTFTRGGGYQSDLHGSTPGQLGSLPARDGDLDGAISSPPFHNSLLTTDEKFMAQVERDKRHGSRLQPGLGTYGSSPAQLGSLREGDMGTESGGTFWSASRQILSETYALPRPYVPGQPGGIACFVVKDYVRSGQRVPFADNWRRLAESVGFMTLYEIRAWVVEDNGTQLAIGGNHKRRVKSHKSFFRRLAERKGSPEINFETVWIMAKPGITYAAA